MLRHFKLELKRQRDETICYKEQIVSNNNKDNELIASNEISMEKQKELKANNKEQTKKENQKRIRGRRSSKPMMEKRRRARINQCLDILKSYVLTDTTNLSQLGIDAMASENQDEETIARKILKTSGLIHRHRGRKNPNKLEKADILELTVDYVRRLHEQRDEWIHIANSHGSPMIKSVTTFNGLNVNQQTDKNNNKNVNSLTSPLSLNMNCLHEGQLYNGDRIQLAANRLANQTTVPPSPPPSSASSSPQPLLSISNNIQSTKSQHNSSQQTVTLTDVMSQQQQHQQQQLTVRSRNQMNNNNVQSYSDVLDLTKNSIDNKLKLQATGQNQNQLYLNRDNSALVYIDNCWRPWNQQQQQQQQQQQAQTQSFL